MMSNFPAAAMLVPYGDDGSPAASGDGDHMKLPVSCLGVQDTGQDLAQ